MNGILINDFITEVLLIQKVSNYTKSSIFYFGLLVISLRGLFKTQYFMPEVSKRGIRMPESPIRKLVPLADKAKASGKKVYHLNIGQPDIPTPQVALDAIKNIDRKILEYSPSEGIRSYREKLVSYYQKYKINVATEDIIITTGGSEAVTYAFLACLIQEMKIVRTFIHNYTAFAIVAEPWLKTIPSKSKDFLYLRLASLNS